MTYHEIMNSLTASERLRLLMNFMLGFPTREQLIVYLSENICPSGELAGVSTASLEDSGEITFEFFYGFKIPHPETTSTYISAAIQTTDGDPVINVVAQEGYCNTILKIWPA